LELVLIDLLYLVKQMDLSLINSKVIIIIGLPGSGKSFISKNLTDRIIFDDFVSTYYNGEAEQALMSDQKVCLIDPRLCVPDVFNRYIGRIEKIVPREEITLVLFSNEPAKCIENVLKRNKDTSSFENSIREYSLRYRPDTYESWNSVEIPVWAPTEI
jgi:hypothetical protein